MTVIERIRKRPFRIIVVGILSILAGLIYLFPVLDLYGLGNLINLSGETFHSGPLVLPAFVIAIANFIIGWGCLSGWRLIWPYLVIISMINLMVALLALLNIDMNLWGTLLIPMIWLVIAIYVLITVLSEKTKVWFHF